MARHTVLLFFTSLLAATTVFAAPAPVPTRALEVRRELLEKRVDDVIVNVGAITTVKTVIKTAVPSTVFVPVVVDGVTETATSVVKVVEEITTTMTQTAVATKVVQTTVVSGKTVPVTLTTTAFDLELETFTAVLSSTSTLYQQSVIIETKQGEPLQKTVTLAATQPPDDQQAQPTKTDTQQAAPTTHKKPDDNPGSATATQGQTGAANTGDPAASASQTLSQPAPSDTSVPDNSLNLNNTADADSGSNAALDSSNTNTNNVTVSLGSGGGIGDWVSENKTIVIVVGVGVAVALVIAIVAAVLECGGSKKSGGGPATGQTVVVSNPDRAVAPQPIANSLARPSRRRYAPVGNQDSSEMSASSDEDEKRSSFGRTSRRGSVASNSSRRSAQGDGGYDEASLGRSSSRAGSRRSRTRM